MKTILITLCLFVASASYGLDFSFDNFIMKNDTVVPHRGEEPVFDDPMPTYPGGDIQMMRDLRDNLVYPKLEKSKGIQGTVYVQFYVDKDGTVGDVKVIRGIKDGKNLDNAALEAVKRLKKFMTTTNYKGGVAFTIPVGFKLLEETDAEPKNNKP